MVANDFFPDRFSRNAVAADHRQYHPLDVLSEPFIGERVEDWVPERVDEDAVEGQDVEDLRDLAILL